MRHSIGWRSLVSMVPLAAGLVLVGCGGSNVSSAPPPPQQQVSLAATVDNVALTAMRQQGIPGMTVALGTNGTVLRATASPI